MLHLMRIDPGAREQELRGYLGGFDFRGDMASAPIERFSGGEKARLVLALIVRARPQLLILDEPTNHLDIEMREALAEALQDFDGALVVVAHDRHLLAATTDTLWLVNAGKVAPFDGDLDDYRDWVLTRERRDAATAAATASGAASGAAPPPMDRKAQKRAEAASRQRLADARKPFLAQQQKIEREIAAMTEERRALELWLASPEAYAAEGKNRLKAAVERQGELNWQLARLEAEWLAVEEKLGGVGAEGGRENGG
jgi:ATP-binding cassette subfamily F protein 3